MKHEAHTRKYLRIKVHTSKKTQSVSITEINSLMLLREIITVYYYRYTTSLRPTHHITRHGNQTAECYGGQTASNSRFVSLSSTGQYTTQRRKAGPTHKYCDIRLLLWCQWSYFGICLQNVSNLTVTVALSLSIEFRSLEAELEIINLE
jgi:hypothetical protein